MNGGFDWRERAVPLRPVAAVVRGSACRNMARRLLARTDEELALLRGVSGDETLVVVGEAEQLPWIDGVAYFGRDPECPSLLLPTHSEPTVCPALLERAMLKRFPVEHAPLLLLPAEALVLSVSTARPISRKKLMAWLRAAN